MDRTRDLPRWPHNAASRFVRCAPHDWHVQEIGEGPLLLMLHGAGSSTHTWRDILPVLATRFRVVALDLPGQGFTRAGTLSRCSLKGMAEDIHSLAVSQSWAPEAIIGHSAGAAIAIALSEKFDTPSAIVGINAALAPFPGIAGWLFPLLARMLALNPFAALLFTAGGNHKARAHRLIKGTGSTIDDAGLDCYAALVADRGHVNATLQMMTQWRIETLLNHLPSVPAKTLFLVGTRDSAVDPETSRIAAARMPDARVKAFDLGHLSHEEAPQATAKAIEGFLSEADSS